MSVSPAQTPDPAALEAAAMACYEAGDLAGAARAFRALLELQPAHATALQFLGFEASQRQDMGAAIDFYRRAANAAPGDAETWFNLAMAHYGRGEWPEALEAFEATLAREPRLLSAQLYRGALLEQMQRAEDSARAYLRAVRFAEANRDPRAMEPNLKQFLNHAMGVVRRYMDAEIDRSLADLVATHGADAVARLRKAGDMFVGKRPLEFAHPKWRPGLFYVPDLPVRVFYEREDFPWTERVEAATEMVRAELLNLMNEGSGFLPGVIQTEGSDAAQVGKEVDTSSNWTDFHFYRDGERIEDNCARCPGTAALLDTLDLQRVPGYGPDVMFSVHAPHSRIAARHGAVNGRLIVHLPLIVPPDSGALSAAGETRGWEEGRLLMFDDSFEHEAWNHSDQPRVVLIFDTWNPDLTAVEREAFSRVLGSAQRFEREALQA